MLLSRLGPIVGLGRSASRIAPPVRTATSSRWGGVLPEPHKTSFGLIRVVVTVTIGLLIGATISKNMANFLEENELFVPSDDDDDDD